MGSLTGVDIIVLLLVIGGGVLGWVRGFVTELLSLFAWVAVVIALKALHAPVAKMLAPHVGTASGAAVLAFALVGLVVFFGGRLVARALGRRTRNSILGPIDRLLGLGFGAVKGLIGATLAFLLFSLVYNYIYGAQAERPAELANSRTFPLLNASGRAVVGFLNAHRADGSQPAGAGPR